MKKTLIILSILLSVINLYAANFIKRYTFDCKSINELKASLEFENLNITPTKGSEIIVEVKADNEKHIPEILCRDSILRITKFNKLEQKYSCDVNLFVPEAFKPDFIHLETKCGKMSLNSLNTKRLEIIPGSENHYSNINTDSLIIGDYDESNIIIDNLNCKMLNISRTVGDISISFTKAPSLNSLIRTKHGNITLSFPEEENFTISADSFNSKFINNFTGVATKQSMIGYYSTTVEGCLNFIMNISKKDDFICKENIE